MKSVIAKVLVMRHKPVPRPARNIHFFSFFSSDTYMQYIVVMSKRMYRFSDNGKKVTVNRKGRKAVVVAKRRLVFFLRNSLAKKYVGKIIRELRILFISFIIKNTLSMS